MSTPDDPTAPGPSSAIPRRIADDVTLDQVPLAQVPTLDGMPTGTPPGTSPGASPGWPRVADSAPQSRESSDSGAFSDSAAPWMLGTFRILGKLGEGGMGIVYEAEQQHPKRLVALKVIRGGRFVDEQHIRMFQREIDTLARLKHPHIGAIYDAGRTDQGEHFFAMELVRGRQLDAFLAARPGPLDEAEIRFRLRLFLSLCDAVHYAHQRGVIHRDLKPSNIVVPEVEVVASLHSPAATPSTSSPIPSAALDPAQHLPEVKILDFGLARITEGDFDQATAMTEVGTIKGTLPYMSPEQARGDSDAIDVRSDVYSLGVILYEMLTGARPYDTAKGSLIESLRIICEQAPKPLAKAWRGSRGPDPDLETITGKALEKEADRRYASAAALAEDVGLYLDSRPILARDPSTIYQLRKFARRNRTLVAGIVATLLALVAGVAVSTNFGLREAAQRRTAEQARKDLETVVDFQREMLDGIDAQKMGTRLAGDLRSRLATSLLERKATASEIAATATGLDAALREINPTDAALRIIDENILRRAIDTAKLRFSAQPLVEAEVLHSIGTTYEKLGLFERAAEPLLEARAISERLLGATALPTLALLHDLGRVYLRQGRIAEAEPLLLAALAGRRQALPADADPVIQTMNDVAMLYGDSERLAESEALYRQTLALQRERHGDDAPFTLAVMNNLGQVLKDAGNLPEAEQLAVATLAGRRRVLGNEDAETMVAVNNLAILYRRTGALDKAEALYLEDYETSRRLLGDEHPDIAVTMTNLGRLYVAKEKYAEAEAILARALALSRKVQPPGYYGTGFTQHAYGDALLGLGRFAEAEQNFLAARKLLVAAMGADSPSLTRVTESLVKLYELTGRETQAADWRRKLPAS
ncbi:MAG: serine/threonine-protein kinase [Thermoanaerobaculia bacterium]